MKVTQTLYSDIHKNILVPDNVTYYGDVVDGKRCFFESKTYRDERLNTKRQLDESEYIYNEADNILQIIK